VLGGRIQEVLAMDDELATAASLPPASGTASSGTALALGLAAAALAACDGGSSDESLPGEDGRAVPLAGSEPGAAITRALAARFLSQAGLGATDAAIAQVQALGYEGWIDAQFALPRSQTHYDWMVASGYAVEANRFNTNGADNTLWRKLISSPDVLRQRMALALSEIFVVSLGGLPVDWRGFLGVAYMDMLEANAFGSYRALLEAVTLSPAMGVYLNTRGNRREDTRTGRVPDENYAREVLQLLSIGLIELAPDGTPRNGVVTETYGQDTVSGLARVFTGWEFDGYNATEPSYATRPMVFIANRHSTLDKAFLGITVPGSTPGPEALRIALDTIAAHPNVGPFIGRQLIQRFTACNPSAAYVARVSAAFADNGAGQRGDLKAVLKAVLLDPEARTVPAAGVQAQGKLREPVLRFAQWARSFGLASPTGLWNIGNTSDPATRLGQSPLRAPSVFNFFRPGYVPPNSVLGQQGITAPEFQITNETTIVGYANWMQTVVAGGAGETRPDYSAELALAADAGALTRRVTELLAGPNMAARSVALIARAVDAISAATDAGRRNRVYTAVLLTLCAPDYLVLQ
jgi:uncharacterized protein (DUF1800 family)